MVSWSSVELLRVDNPRLGQRIFHPRAVQREPEIVAAFGSASPSSDTVLLHTYEAPGAERGAPVILVHGANRNAAYFLDPHEDGSFRDPLPEALRRAGRQVYAVSFAHNQDDNWWWCEALNEAILAVSSRHGGRVVLLGHSKGGVAVRLAATPWRPVDRIRDLSRMVERLLLIGCPNGGVDFFYRYPSVNLAFSGPGSEAILNWPTSWSSINMWGRWTKLPQWYGGTPSLYPGQAQLLGRWREVYPLPGLDPNEEMTYEGGESLIGKGRGISEEMAAAGDMIGELRRRATPPEIAVALLAGASPTMPGVLNDTTGPSDGIVYVQSALEYPEGSSVVEARALPVHHKALIAEPSAQAAIVEALGLERGLSPVELEARRQEALALGARWAAEAKSPASQGQAK